VSGGMGRKGQRHLHSTVPGMLQVQDGFDGRPCEEMGGEGRVEWRGEESVVFGFVSFFVIVVVVLILIPLSYIILKSIYIYMFPPP